jgi:transcriptional regulator
MRHNPAHATTDPEAVRDLVRQSPWATIVSDNAGELVASHYPILLDESAAGLVLLTHVGRPDEEVHGFGDREVLVIVQGTHGYVSPSWYGPGATRAPTCNFSVVHIYGVPEVLGADENLATLTGWSSASSGRSRSPFTWTRTGGGRSPRARSGCGSR